MGETLDLQKTEPVFRLIYRSRSKAPPGDRAHVLGGILRVSRATNAACGITGVLMIHDDRFAQVLEGPEAAVRALYARIKLDPRHDTVQVRGETMAARVFARWAMAEAGDGEAADLARAGLAEAGRRTAPERVRILAALRDLTHGHGRGG